MRPFASFLDDELIIARMGRCLNGVPLNDRPAPCWAYVRAGFSNADILAFDDAAVRVAEAKRRAFGEKRRDAA